MKSPYHFTQGGALTLDDSEATLVDLILQGNEAPQGQDIYKEGASSFTCGTSCGIGQYGNCSKTALTNDANDECYVNCGLCLSCQAGTSNPNAGSALDSDCEACGVGHASTRAGAASCTSCEAGHYATDDGEQYGVITKATNCSAVC